MHYDRGFRAPLGHGPRSKIGKWFYWKDVDDPTERTNVKNRAFARCNYTTTELEKIWFKYNIIRDGFDNSLEGWLDNPSRNAKLPEKNPWFSYLPYSSLIDY